MKIAVVGGGIAGLAAALRVRERAPAAEVIVIEQSTRLGGKLHTGQLTAVDGTAMPVELGAENFLVRDPATGLESAAVRLARRLGLGDELVHPALGKAALALSGPPGGRVGGTPTLKALPGGTLMGVPGRLDLLGDVVKPAAERDRDGGHPLLKPGEDVAVGRLVRDRLGDQVVDRLVDPLLGGVYAGRADLLSLIATMPGLAAACTTSHTLTGAVRAAVNASRAHGGGPVFATIPGGVSRLVDAIDAELAGSGRKLGSPVRELQRTPAGWRLVLGPVPQPEVIEADGVVLAVPARPAARLLGTECPSAAAEIGVLDYASVALVTLALPPVALPELSGILVPAGEFAIKASTFFTRKWTHFDRPDGTVVVRASLGRYGELASRTGKLSGDEQVLQRDDAELVALVQRELSVLLGPLPDPVDTVVQRWGGALPQYAPGHVDRVARARAAIPSTLALAGAAYDGVGIPACVRSGETAAERLLGSLGQWPV